MWQQSKTICNFLTNFFLDLVFPKFCFGCKKEGLYICQNCKNNLQINHYTFCPLCKNKTSLLRGCAHHKTHTKFCLAPFSYDNILIKDLLHNFKYNFAKSIGPELAQFMTESIKNSKLLSFRANELSSFIVVPVPLHKKRLAWRGFNQSEVLAKEISKNLSLEIFFGLKRTRNTKPQIEMTDRDERQGNIKDAFVCENKNKIKKKIVILVDDMITTGSTVEECAKILKKSGASEIWAITVAK